MYVVIWRNLTASMHHFKVIFAKANIVAGKLSGKCWVFIEENLDIPSQLVKNVEGHNI
jgi:hypothetical protein